MKVFIGIDPSLTATGICVLDQAGAEILRVTFGEKTKRGVERLDAMDLYLHQFMARWRAVPALVAVEGYSFGSFSGRERLGEWGGVLRLCLHRLDFPYVEVPPTTLKKFVTGAGNAKKNQMLLGVYKKWGVTCADDNEADSYALAQFIRTGQVLKSSKKEN